MSKLTPIKWELRNNANGGFLNLGGDDIYIVSSADLKTITVVINSVLATTDTCDGFWSYITIPLKCDGNAHTVELDSSQNSNIHKLAPFDFKDGRLYYSCIERSGKHLFAVKLVPFSFWKSVVANGNGIYFLEDIVGDYNRLAGSVQNIAGNLAGAATNLAEMVADMYSGNGVGATLQGVSAINELAEMKIRSGVRDPAEISKDIVDEVTSKGFNYYYTKLKQKYEQEQNQKTHESNLSTKYALSASNISENTMMMVAGLGIILLLILFVVKSK